MFDKLFQIFFKKKEGKLNYPYEHYRIVWGDESQRNGHYDSPFSKEIKLFRGEHEIIYPYDVAIVKALDERGIPGVDMTLKKPDYPVIHSTRPEILREVRYVDS